MIIARALCSTTTWSNHKPSAREPMIVPQLLDLVPDELDHLGPAGSDDAPALRMRPVEHRLRHARGRVPADGVDVAAPVGKQGELKLVEFPDLIPPLMALARHIDNGRVVDKARQHGREIVPIEGLDVRSQCLLFDGRHRSSSVPTLSSSHYRRGWNSSTGLPEGSSRRICDPPGPVTMSLRNWTPAARSRRTSAARSSTIRWIRFQPPGTG